MRPINWGAELRVLAQRYGERPAVLDGRGTATHAQIHATAAAIAQALIAAGVRPGDAVATCFRNDRDAVAAMFATMLAGATEVPLNPALAESDRLHCCSVAQVRLILTSEALSGTFNITFAPVLTVERVAPARYAADGYPSVAADAPARIVFTSGTTGKPKGAVHSQQGRWTANLLLRAALPERPGPHNRVLLMTPFSHGTSLMTHAYLSTGASVALRDGVDTTTILPLIESGTCDAMFAPPTVLAKIVDTVGDRQIRTLRTIFCGTAVLKPTLYARAKAVFGPIVRVTYGKSEVFNPITVLEADETDAWYATGGGDACVGWPAAGVELAIHDEHGRPAAAGETGEILIRARHMMTGYSTAEGFRPLREDGYHDTGDLGYLDADGRLHLTGRMADIIKSGGYKIAPEDIERELAPALQPSEIAVLGLPSDYWGEVVLAAVERPPADWQERLAPILPGMTGYKRPRLFVALDELPRNGIGKIMRSQIREVLLSRYGLIDGPHPRLEPLVASGTSAERRHPEAYEGASTTVHHF